MKTPYGASAIIELRKAGNRPADMVLVSLIGPLRDEVNPVVMVNDQDCDFRFLHGLEVMVVCTMETPREFVKRVADDIVAVAPAYAGIWFRDRGDGLNLCWGSYKPKAKAIRRWTSAERSDYASHQGQH